MTYLDVGASKLNECQANPFVNIALIWFYKDHQYSLNIDDHSRQ